MRVDSSRIGITIISGYIFSPQEVSNSLTELSIRNKCRVENSTNHRNPRHPNGVFSSYIVEVTADGDYRKRPAGSAHHPQGRRPGSLLRGSKHDCRSDRRCSILAVQESPTVRPRGR